MRPEQLYLLDIVAAAEAIAEFVAEVDEAGFYLDHKTQSAVIQKLLVIGEAASRISPEFRTNHAEIEWQDIVAFRNILIHAYFSVQLEIIWATVQHDVPELQRDITRILLDEFEES